MKIVQKMQSLILYSMKANEIKISYKRKNINPRTIIKSSKQTFDFIINCWNKNTIEAFESVKLILMDRANAVLGIYNLSNGGLDSSVIDVKIIYSIALKCLASSIIIVHNHPSGNIIPSNADLLITRKIKDGCKILSINFLDHLIISNSNFYSFADSGEI